MQEITNNILIEDQYPGVTLGVIVTNRGLIQIDAPPSPEDARSWRAALMNLGGGLERVLINLDAHPDRTLGARAMDCTVIAHERTANTFRTRPSTFKAQGEETGADWESLSGLGSVRWVPPEVSFGEQMTLHWNDSPVLLEYHPGPTNGSIWVHLPKEKILFIGDTVMKNQPPFLAGSNLKSWITSVSDLLDSSYKGYTFVSGRGGTVTPAVIKTQLEFLKSANEKLGKIKTKKPQPAVVEKTVTALMKKIKAPAARQKQFTQRLRYGITHYNSRQHQASIQQYED